MEQLKNKKTRTQKIKILEITIGIISLILIITGLVLSITNKGEIEKVKCYDRYGSDIEGLTCNRDKVKDGVAIIMFGILFAFGYYLIRIVNRMGVI